MGNKIIPCGGWYVNDEHFTITYQNGKPIIDIIPEEAINDFVKKSGDTMSGSLDLENSSLLAEDVISKQVTVSSSLDTTGIHFRVSSTNDLNILKEDSTTGEDLPLANINIGEATSSSHAINKEYADQHYVGISDGKLTIPVLNADGSAIINASKLSTNDAVPLFIGATIESSTTNGVRLTSTTDQAAAFVLPNTQNTYVPLYIANPTNASQAATKSYVDSKYEEDIANAVQTYLQSNEGKAYLSSLLGENN